VDEDLTRSTTCGVGACAGNTGTETCTAGLWGDNTCDPDDGASDEVCYDDIDNDCDGDTDEEGCLPNCNLNLPEPVLDLTDREIVDYGPYGFSITYYFTVTNRAEYPDDMFAQDPIYPSCYEGTGSRTTVEIYDNDDERITEHCDFTSPDDLETFSFTIYNDRSYPSAVYVIMEDRECGNTYLSNTVTDVPPDGAVTSREVEISVIDINSIQDDYYDLYVNGEEIGPVNNPPGGTTTYNVTLNSGSNTIELRLTERMGRGTYLQIDINSGEFTEVFSGSNDHLWTIISP
jgi:hypothetical protein